jgi:hypothetical protein
MASKRPQLNLDELRRLKWLLGGALALISLWAVFFLDVEALGLVAFASAAVAVALVWPQIPARAPRFVGWLAVPALVIEIAVDFYLSTETLPPLIRLGILLVLYRGVSYRERREDLQLIVLCLFLIVVAGVLTVTLGFAVVLLMFTACALGLLFVITLVETKQTSAVAAAAIGGAVPGGPPAWALLGWRQLFVRLRAVADWRLMAFAAGLFAVVVLLSGLLFLVIPRFEIATGFFLDRYITKKSRTGFTETVRFGDVGELSRDDSTALRVDLSEPETRPADPYWRLVVLDEYTREGFRLSAGARAELLRSQGARMFLPGRAGGRTGVRAGGQWTFYLEPGVSRFLPLPGSFGAMRLRETGLLQYSERRWIVALRTEPMTMTAYRLENVELQREIVEPGFSGELAAVQAGRRQPLVDPRLMLKGPAGPDNQAAMQRILAEVTGGAADLPVEEFARRACDWLAAKHAYSLSVSLPRGARDDIVRWVDSNQPGFCEYFASAFVVLARAAGHPARVVAGFRGGTWNALENYYQVRNSDAHAWAEIYTGPTRRSWLRVDPTPGNGGVADQQAATQPAAARAGDRSWSARLDSLRMMWYRRVVSFDRRAQAEMVEQVKTLTTQTGERLRAALDRGAARLRAWLAGPWDWRRAARWAGGLLAAAVGVWLVIRGWREARLRWMTWGCRNRPDPVRHEAGRRLTQLRQMQARRTIRPVPEWVAEYAAVTADLQRLRYGPADTWPEPRAVFGRARRLRRAARG